MTLERPSSEELENLDFLTSQAQTWAARLVRHWIAKEVEDRAAARDLAGSINVGYSQPEVLINLVEGTVRCVVHVANGNEFELFNLAPTPAAPG